MTRTPSKPLFVSVILYDLQLLNKVISSILELREFAKSMIASLSSDVLTVNHLVTIAKVTKAIAKVNMSVAFVQEHMKHGHAIALLHCVVQTARKLVNMAMSFYMQPTILFCAPYSKICRRKLKRPPLFTKATTRTEITELSEILPFQSMVTC